MKLAILALVILAIAWYARRAGDFREGIVTSSDMERRVRAIQRANDSDWDWDKLVAHAAEWMA